jgi:SAM-dependent methyltransferase
MSVRGAIKSSLKLAARRLGYRVHPMTDEDRAVIDGYDRASSTRGHGIDFTANLSTLRDLKARYAEVRLPITRHSIWTARGGSDTRPDIGRGGVDLELFRGHTAYVFSYAGSDPVSARLRYFIYADAVRRKDTAGLLRRLEEDGAFGCITFEYPNLGRVSRDLLDSVRELNFLQEHYGLLDRRDLEVLDIGSGYGRMAHRMLAATPAIKRYTCVDAIPESTFLCRLYLEHRGCLDRARVVPLDQLVEQLGASRFDLALNINSFAECTFAAIEWWLTQLKRLGVPKLLIVQNDPERFRSTEPDGSRRDYAPVLGQLGYTMTAHEPVFDDPAVEALLGTRDNLFLFTLSDPAR